MTFEVNVRNGILAPETRIWECTLI